MAMMRIALLSAVVLASALAPQVNRWSNALDAGVIALAANSNDNSDNCNSNTNSNTNGNTNGNDNGSNNNNSNDNGNCNSNSNNNSNDNSNRNQNHNDNHNQGGAVPPGGPVQSSSAPAGPATGGETNACLPGGQEGVLLSEDGRIAVRVYPSMQRDIRIIIRMPVDKASVPNTPGPRVDNLLFQVLAENCDGGALARLPAEVNLAVNYKPEDAGGLNKQNFTIALLDMATNQWKPVAKQAVDAPDNHVSASTSDLGFYVVYQK